ncbi:LysR family transcriptional regulator [Cognatiyoonia sp. IB215182]|uniref:LysR family transcriptional regulator n=1 Tax=Cognatiyoonia sp. IB215182 TaxID=3097353 RepID=UPI002A0EAF6C|nr:LysR family transcriptional regulator [Cognatiyoonia sp. IB215182]MDX8351132.1 LysR family transcriptional regulator [Cognatiyoonia sp. IB215182]
MNWQALNFDWNQARAFLVTAETGSFSAAARALKMTQPTLGRQVAGLEEALDIVLFERIGRKLELTPAGRDMLVHLRAMGESAIGAALTASGRSETVTGEVCISVTDIFAVYIMPHIVTDLRRIAPQVRIKVLASNALSDLQRREADIAVRHVAPTQPDLIARKVRRSFGHLYASRDYLRRIGPIRSVEDVARADIIGIDDAEELITFLQNWGLPVSAKNLAILGGSGVASWEFARQGLGLMPMTEDLASAFPDMEMILPDLEPVEVPYWLTVHRELHSSKRIRLVYDHLAQVLGQRTLPGPRQTQKIMGDQRFG